MLEAQERSRFGLAQKWWVLIAVGVGTLMTALDGSVVNTILPVITRQFGTTLATTGWVVTTYLLVVSGFLLSFGRLGDLYGHKRVYVFGFALFVAGSIACGQAPSVLFLILARGFQAVGGAMLASNSPAIVTRSFPGSQRGQALGITSTMTYLGLTIGPTVGGYLATALGWRWVFLINVPIGGLALALSLLVIPRDALHNAGERFDPAGAAMFLVGLVALLLALNRGSAWGWDSPPTLGLLAGALAVLAGFIAIERRLTCPMLDLSLFRSRLFSAATTTAVLNYICLYGLMLLMPFYLIQQRGLTPDRAGLILSAQPLIMAVAAPIAGTLSDRMGSRLLSTLGMGISALGLALMAGVGPATPLPLIVLDFALIGLGVGIFVSPNTNALMGSAPRGRQGIASGVMATARNTGMVLGVGISSAIFNTVQANAAAAGVAAPFFPALRAAFLTLAGVAALGTLTSLTRGNGAPDVNRSPAR